MVILQETILGQVLGMATVRVVPVVKEKENNSGNRERAMSFGNGTVSGMSSDYETDNGTG